MNDVFNASAFLTDVLRRYTNIEANYRDQTVPDVEHLEDRIVAVYKAVLEFSAKVRENQKMGAGCMCTLPKNLWAFSLISYLLARILETFYSLDNPALQELKSRVNRADLALENWRQLIEHECQCYAEIVEAYGGLTNVSIDRIKESTKIEERVNKVLESTKDASAKLSILMTNAESAPILYINNIKSWAQLKLISI